MTPKQMADLFNAPKSTRDFKLVENKRSSRPDLHAFLLLDSLFPGRTDNIISNFNDLRVWLDVAPKDLAAVATEDQVRELVHCGVMLDQLTEGLFLYY